jgi:hypothetical protein
MRTTSNTPPAMVAGVAFESLFIRCPTRVFAGEARDFGVPVGERIERMAKICG